MGYWCLLEQFRVNKSQFLLLQEHMGMQTESGCQDGLSLSPISSTYVQDMRSWWSVGRKASWHQIWINKTGYLCGNTPNSSALNLFIPVCGNSFTPMFHLPKLCHGCINAPESVRNKSMWINTYAFALSTMLHRRHSRKHCPMKTKKLVGSGLEKNTKFKVKLNMCMITILYWFYTNNLIKRISLLPLRIHQTD